MERFGIYIHIPYCLQQCPYCDFATVLNTHPLKKEDYIDIVRQEIRNRNQAVPFRKVSTLYFGGGTPSLLSPSNLDAVIRELGDTGFDLSSLEEVSLEINPGTLTKDLLNDYLGIGISRFSVGAQTFSDRLLKLLGREHSSSETRETLDLIASSQVNYTVDLLYALPEQSMEDLLQDLDTLKELNPPHVSAYCLTVPDKNPRFFKRPSEDVQVAMFYRVEEELRKIGLSRYEVSSYTAPGRHSRHNSLYWEDQSYWGLGMSAHSYFKTGDWGIRFWNPPHLVAYEKQVRIENKMTSRIDAFLPTHQFEALRLHQSLTDFCHTRLRTMQGLSMEWLSKKFPPVAVEKAKDRLTSLMKKGLVEVEDSVWRISHQKLILSEQVYQEMTFLSSEL